ncbi:MAG: filamentous hemagglutinin N-terminal domain-containing protein, partial [Phycisphaerales bacterium]|nr:filamentous hemagglutinin N-terminal domain-containing protein [Phycisphaerales bacterium]
MSTTILRASRRSYVPAVLACLAGTAFSTSIFAPDAYAGPKGTRVSRGWANVQRDGATTIIRTGKKTILDHESFDIGLNETVQFIQPNAKSRVLNRITGAAPTNIEGTILANGRVYIVNPAGVYFGDGAVVNAAQVYAGAATITDRDFMKGRNHFTDVRGAIVNEGMITADAVHLIGQSVANHGVIVTDQGVVSMQVGDDVYLRERGRQVSARITGAGNAAGGPGTIENTGVITAPGGFISLGAGDALSVAVRNTGSISAAEGRVELHTAGAVDNAGMIDAGAGTGHAGRIDINAGSIRNTGIIAAEAHDGQAGWVSLAAADDINLDGGRVSASGGVGDANGGTVLIRAGGNAVLAEGAKLDVSGGDEGGQGGFLDLSGKRSVTPLGAMDAGAVEGERVGTILLDPDFWFIGDVDGVNEISVATIEATPGTVLLEATFDIRVLKDINKTNGGLHLTAGRDIFLGMPGLGDLSITADDLVFTAFRSIIDHTMNGTALMSAVGDIILTATNGNVDFGTASVPDLKTVSITQRDGMRVGANWSILNPERTRLDLNVTQGGIVFEEQFGVDNTVQYYSIDATSKKTLEIRDNIVLGAFGEFKSFADVKVDGSVSAPDHILMHSGLDGSGNVTFQSTGLTIASDDITLMAGLPGIQGDSSYVNAQLNVPTFTGPGGTGNPTSFAIRHDVDIVNGLLPLPGQFGDGDPNCINYLGESFEGNVQVTNGAAFEQTYLTLRSASAGTPGDSARTFVNDDLDLKTLTIDGLGTLGADIVTSGFQQFNGSTLLSADVELTGAEITFADELNATTPGAQSLTINADLAATFEDGVGVASELESLTFNSATGTLHLDGGAVNTSGDQTYNGAVRLGRNNALTSSHGGDLSFGGPVDGTFDLDLLTTESGLIVFAGPVGATDRLRDLTMCTTGADGMRPIPDRATIIGRGDDVEFHVRDFVMCQNEKLTAADGNLLIDASRDAFLGDLSSASDMTVSAQTITLQLRDAFEVLGGDGSVLPDAGLDFVAGGAMHWDGVLVNAGSPGAPVALWGNPDGMATGTALTGVGIVAMEVPDATTTLLAGASPDVVLDM